MGFLDINLPFTFSRSLGLQLVSGLVICLELGIHPKGRGLQSLLTNLRGQDLLSDPGAGLGLPALPALSTKYFIFPPADGPYFALFTS